LIAVPNKEANALAPGFAAVYNKKSRHPKDGGTLQWSIKRDQTE
jgi:hypothetical protein